MHEISVCGRYPIDEVRAAVRTILLLEDDDAFADAVRDLLGESGYETSRARTIVEARRALGRERIECVLLDLGLRDERGRHFLDDVAALPDAPPVLVLSGLPEAPAVAKEFGIACVGKPFSAAELLVAVSATISHTLRPIARRRASGARARTDVLSADETKTRRGA